MPKRQPLRPSLLLQRPQGWLARRDLIGWHRPYMDTHGAYFTRFQCKINAKPIRNRPRPIPTQFQNTPKPIQNQSKSDLKTTPNQYHTDPNSEIHQTQPTATPAIIAAAEAAGMARSPGSDRLASALHGHSWSLFYKISTQNQCQTNQEQN